MQKRIVLVLLVLLAASMSVFAMDQASVAARLPYFEFNSNQSQTTMIAGGANNTLFAGVDGFALTEEAMLLVEGEGLPAAMLEDGSSCSSMTNYRTSNYSSDDDVIAQRRRDAAELGILTVVGSIPGGWVVCVIYGAIMIMQSN